MGKRCDRCGRRMPEGALAYEVRIQVAADFDGVLPDPEGPGEMEAALCRLLGELERADPERLQREICHIERHLLCPPCRERYLANPLNLPLPEGQL